MKTAISAAGYHDISVSFAILPAFLQYTLSMLREDTLLRRFISQVSENGPTVCEFLHFHHQDMPEAKNLLENMARILLKRRRNSRQILQATMGVLLLDLPGRTCDVGYENSSHFHRLFKTTYGMTPGKYRRCFPMTEWV